MMKSSQPPLAHTITVINLKGGVGKTHTAWLLASVCQQRELKLLAMDTDTQANFSRSFLESDNERPGVEALLNPAADPSALDLVCTTPFSHIDLIPASTKLAPFDLSDPEEWKRGDLHLSFVDAIAELRTHYDYVVIDCPPRLSLVSIAALCASDSVIIPLEAADWGAQGIMQVTKAIEHVQAHYNPRLQLLGYLVSRFKRARAYQKSYLEQLHDHFGDLAFDTVIPDLARFEKAVTDAVPITLHSPSSEETSIAHQFFDEVQTRIQRLHRSRTAGRKAHIRIEPESVA